MNASSLSLVIIASHEERDLPGCLATARELASETVVVVNEGSDPTTELARSLGAKVFIHPFKDYGSQKQYALEQATGDWVLNLDADERLPPELTAEIRSVLEGRGPAASNGLFIPVDIEFLGRVLRFGGAGSEKKLRMFRRGTGRFDRNTVHEGVEVSGPTAVLEHPMLHRPYANLSEYIKKFDRYTSMGADRARREGRRFRWWQHLRLPLEFVKRYFLQLGLLDGGPGFAWCGLAAMYSWMKMLKLRELEKADA
jgi:glycosyltransferase involved in cell wall biosynthesis